MLNTFAKTKRLFNSKQFLETIGTKTNLYLLRKQLEKDSRFQIGLAEFYTTSAKFSISENEAKSLIQEWNKLGLIILENDNVIIKPEMIYKKFYDAVSPKNEVSDLKAKIETIKDQISTMEAVKAQIDEKAKGSLRRIAWTSSLYLTLQLGVLMHMTWIDYGWDVVEPLSYFASFFTVYLGVIYFVFFKNEYQYDDVYVRLYKSKTAKLYLKENFDINKFEALKKELEELNKELSIKCLI